MTSKNGVYVFCAIQEKKPIQFGTVLLNGQENEVYTIHHQDVAMVAARVDDEVLPVRNNLLAHQSTISNVMKQYTIIPMSFGNVFHSEEDVILITKHLYEELDKLFSELENKIEVGLKVQAKKDWIEQEMKKDPLLNEWKNAKKDLAAPGSFYEQIEIGEHAQNFVMLLENRVEKEIYEPLLELAAAGKLNRTIPGKILLNSAFLVEKDQEESFDQKVNELYEVWQDKVDFKYSGPWPAYNFVNIRLRIEGKS